MGFWEMMALGGLITSVVIGCSEGFQIWMQRKALLELRRVLERIDERFKGLDVGATVRDTTEVTREALMRLQGALVAELEPLRLKVQALDVDAMISAAIDQAASKVDAAAIANVVADKVLERAREGMPQIVEAAKSQVVEGTPGAQSALNVASMFEEDPLLGAIFAAVASRAPGPTQAQQPATGGKRTV